MNSVFSVGLQPYLSQSIISVLCCSISLFCGIIASVELFLGIQNIMETELITSKDFYILSSDIFKTLSVERQYRTIDGKVYLDNIHTKYCNLIEQCNLINKKIENFKIASVIGKEMYRLTDKNTEEQEQEQEKGQEIALKIVNNNIKDTIQTEINNTKLAVYEYPKIEYENL